MSAGINDKFTDTFNSANPNVARVTAGRTAGATSLTCDNLAGWPTGTAVHFSTYQINTSNAVVAGTQIDWKGIVSGNSIGTLTRQAGATDAGNSIGDVVEMNPTGSWGHDYYTGMTAQHNQDGTHGAITSTGATLTTPKVITSINDTNGNELAKVTATASAINEITLANAAVGNGPTISATGDDTNIDLNLAPKGTGVLKVGGNIIGTGAWTSFTPTWTNLTVGNGTNTSKYTQVGKTIICRYEFVFGSTSSISGAVNATLPVTAVAYSSTTLYGQALYVNTGVAEVTGTVEVINTTSALFYVNNATGTYVAMTNLSSTVPHTWATGHKISAIVIYEAA